MQFFIRCDKEHSSEKDPARQNFKICIQTLTLTSLLLRDMASWVPLPDQQWVVIGETPNEEMVIILCFENLEFRLWVDQFADSGQSTRT